MANNVFDILVKRLMKYKTKLMDGKKIELIVNSFAPEEVSVQKIYKLIYYLKLRGYLENIKKNVFFVKDPDRQYTQDEILDLFYRTMVKRHCSEYLTGHWYISGVKALELNLNSYAIPEELSIVNAYKQSTEVLMLDKQIIFKTYSKQNVDNLFAFFRKLTKPVSIGKFSFPIACLELSILESLYNPSMITQTYINELVKKVIRKYHKTLNIAVFESILRKNKHNTSINRLYDLAKGINPEFADKLKGLIKRYGYVI